jgi:hypothetical protein
MLGTFFDELAKAEDLSEIAAGLTDAGTRCACFRDHGMTAEAPQCHCENPLIKELRRPKLTERDWQFFPERAGLRCRDAYFVTPAATLALSD